MCVSMYGEETFAGVKRRTIRTAKDLFYSDKCIDKLKKATTEKELTQIMCAERHRLMRR